MRIILIILMLFPMGAFADNPHANHNHPKFFDITGFTPKEMMCYGRAMIGFDSVINARSGIFPPDAFPTLDSTIPLSPNDMILAKVIFGAFQWTGSPHTYAIKTFGACISN